MLLLLACSTSDSDDSSTNRHAAAVTFVQRFYDWYVPLGDGPTVTTRYDSLARNESGWFTPALAAALTNDLEVQRHDTTGDIVSITSEIDPFVASQDPCPRYEARDGRDSSGRVVVSVYPVCNGRAAAKPSILVEVSVFGDGLQISNFRNPDYATSDVRQELANTRPASAKAIPRP